MDLQSPDVCGEILNAQFGQAGRASVHGFQERFPGGPVGLSIGRMSGTVTQDLANPLSGIDALVSPGELREVSWRNLAVGRGVPPATAIQAVAPSAVRQILLLTRNGHVEGRKEKQGETHHCEQAQGEFGEMGRAPNRLACGREFHGASFGRICRVPAWSSRARTEQKESRILLW